MCRGAGAVALDRVGTVAAVDRVLPAEPDDVVVPGKADDRVVARCPDEGVIARRPGDRRRQCRGRGEQDDHCGQDAPAKSFVAKARLPWKVVSRNCPAPSTG